MNDFNGRLQRYINKKDLIIYQNQDIRRNKGLKKREYVTWEGLKVLLDFIGGTCSKRYDFCEGFY
eukprot:snap_masked-scaffold_52-processed-gene-1.35-mRNA-1 protein AED:1.00 eAED:1.00 QI:0/0/0/0/1/1/2/0/64